MTTMQDLKDAIEYVLEDAAAWDEVGSTGPPGTCRVDRVILWRLQQEYNIHFIEPDEEQGKWI